MEDFDACYRAVASRDRRFDGRFVTAVTSTGIYCRPSCPARTPRRANVRFYRVAAAAEAAGFRACRRCRPDTAPGSPDWDVRADLASRALQLLASGVVDGEGVSGLASRLAVSERHLHRQLRAEVGATALALARTRRAQTARLLVESTELSMSEVAFAAGFASIRQFNDTMRAAFGCPPGRLRERRGGPAAGEGPQRDPAGPLVVRLAHRGPLAVGPLLAHFAARAVAGVELVEGRAYRRAVRLPHGPAVVELRAEGERSPLTGRLWLSDLRDLAAAVARCRWLADLDADPAAVDGALAADPVLAPLVSARPGLRVPGGADGFEVAVRTLLGQQVSLAAARTLAGRLVVACGEPLGPALAGAAGPLTHLFPTAEALADADLSELGLTGARVRAVRALAAAVHSGRIALDPGADRQEARRRLAELPGVGPWTVEYVALRALGDPDAFPAGDLGLRRALGGVGAREAAAAAQRWRPWRGYAAQHLWTAAAAGGRP